MDLVASCRDKLACFRIKELKDVLTQLGLVKQGKKQDLVDRILQLLSDEQVPKSQVWGKRNSFWKDEVAKIIDDAYRRKILVPGATDLASKSGIVTDYNQVKPKEEIDDYRLEMKVRCPCGNSFSTDSIIQVLVDSGAPVASCKVDIFWNNWRWHKHITKCGKDISIVKSR